jgi:hypothetical protein
VHQVNQRTGFAVDGDVLGRIQHILALKLAGAPSIVITYGTIHLRRRCALMSGVSNDDQIKGLRICWAAIRVGKEDCQISTQNSRVARLRSSPGSSR